MAQIINVEELLPNFGAASTPLTDNLEYDLGNLTAFDPTPLPQQKKGVDFESSLLSLARDNTQLLLTRIFQLPTETLPHDQGRLALLPAPTTALPREKPVPKPKEPTKWEAFAKLKGIQKKKRGRMVFDEATQQYAPRWGYKSAKAQAEQAEWAVDAGADAQTGAEDPWTLAAAEKKARVAKNKKQQERNVLRSAAKGSKNRVDGAIDLRSAVELSQQQLGMGAKGGKRAASEKKNKKPAHHVDVALAVAQRSTASMGRFDTLRTHEPAPAAPKSATNRAQRHEASSRAMKGGSAERGAALDVLGKVLTGQKDNDNYGESKRINTDKIASMGQQMNEKKNIDKKRKQASSSSKKGKGGGGKKQKR